MKKARIKLKIRTADGATMESTGDQYSDEIAFALWTLKGWGDDASAKPLSDPAREAFRKAVAAFMKASKKFRDALDVESEREKKKRGRK